MYMNRLSIFILAMLFVPIPQPLQAAEIEQPVKIPIPQQLTNAASRATKYQPTWNEKLTPKLIKAIKNCYDDEVAKLLRQEANPNAKNADGRPMLMLAAQSGKQSVIKLLVSADADIDATDNQLRTPLFYAYEYAVAKLLIRRGATINKRDSNGDTPLIHAVTRGKTNLTRALLEANADTTLRGSKGKTAKELAGELTKKRPEMLQVFANKDNRRKLFHAIRNRDFTTAEKLLGEEVSADTQDPATGVTVLMYAADRGDIKIVNLLLGKNASIDTQERNGRTALMFAVHNNHTNVVRTLVQADANIDAEDNHHWTPLMHAARLGRKAIVQYFLQNKANTTIQNDDGNTAEMLANTNKHFGIAKMIREFEENEQKKKMMHLLQMQPLSSEIEP